MYLSDVNISTYVISLAVSEECKKEIKKEFSGRLEFKLKMVPYINCNRTSDFLWNTFCSIVSEAINSDDDVIVICKEDHKFTPNYRCEGFIKDVITASELGCQLIWGGARSFGIAVPLTERLFWIDWAWGSQFIVLFRSAFMKVLDSCFIYGENEFDNFLSTIIPNKMVLYPFISKQHEYDCSNYFECYNNPEVVSVQKDGASFRLKKYLELSREYNAFCIH